MKGLVIFMICLCPVLAFAQQEYTNADLVDIDVPGAYNNEDLRKLPPLAVQERPAAPGPAIIIPPVDSSFYQAAFDDLNRVRRSLQAELDYEAGQIAFSESAFAGRTQSAAPRLGYRNKVRGLVRELIKRIAMVDAQIEFVLDDARKAGASVDKR